MSKNWQDSTNQARNSAWQGLEAFSQQQLGKPAVMCNPNDVVVYLESTYIKQHGRQRAADGSCCPAPSSVSGIVAHLSTRFQELGRRGVWDWATLSGNPCSSMELRTFKGGYANQMQDQGYEPAAAKPISGAKLQQLVWQLQTEAQQCQQSSQQSWYTEALLWRDAAIVQYLWDSKRRPAELGHLGSQQVSIGGSSSGGSSGPSSTVASAGSSRPVFGLDLTATPTVSKMCHASHGNRGPAPVELGGQVGQQLGTLFLQYSGCLQRHGKSLGRFMFSPLRADKQDLQGDKGLSSSAMGQRVVGHLKRLGLYEGESLYSIKRGAMQHDYFILGRSLQAIGDAADIATAAVVSKYVDPHRPTFKHRLCLDLSKC